MAIIIEDFKPSGAKVEVVLPGSKKKWSIATADDTLEVADLAAINAGDFSPLWDVFPEEAHPLLDKLKVVQLRDLFQAWARDKGE